jgi:creatinine amidohydrolase
MERVPDEPAVPLNRMEYLPPTYTGIWWYSDYPDHYAGDARFASEEKGQTLVRLAVDCLAQYIAVVKADEVVPALNQEFFRRVGQV